MSIKVWRVILVTVVFLAVTMADGQFFGIKL